MNYNSFKQIVPHDFRHQCTFLPAMRHTPRLKLATPRTRARIAYSMLAETPPPLELRLRIKSPMDIEPKVRVFQTAQDLHAFVSRFKKAMLASFETPTQPEEYFSPRRYISLPLDRTYFVFAPLHSEEASKLRHNQIEDRAFEDKCRKSIVEHHRLRHRTLKELDRVLTHELPDVDGAAREVPAIEWDGLWFEPGGVYHLLECKHYMTIVPSFTWSI
jgi:hypothetical protein